MAEITQDQLRQIFEKRSQRGIDMTKETGTANREAVISRILERGDTIEGFAPQQPTEEGDRPIPQPQKAFGIEIPGTAGLEERVKEIPGVSRTQSALRGAVSLPIAGVKKAAGGIEEIKQAFQPETFVQRFGEDQRVPEEVAGERELLNRLEQAGVGLQKIGAGLATTLFGLTPAGVIGGTTVGAAQPEIEGAIKKITEDPNIQRTVEKIKQKIDPSTTAAVGNLIEAVFSRVGATKTVQQVPAALGKQVSKGVELVGEVTKTLQKARALAKEKSFLQGLGEKRISKTQSLADQTTSNVNRILPNKAEEFKTLTGGKTHGQWLNERGINKTPDKNIDTLADKFIKEKSVLDDAIAEVPGIHNPASIKPVLDDAAAWAADTADKQGQRLLNGIRTKLEQQGGLEAKDIIELKRYYERNTKFGYSKDLNAKKTAFADNIDSALREDLIKIAEQGGFDEFRALSKEIQQTRFVMDQIGIAQSRAASKDLFNISDRILGGVSVIEPKALLGIATVKGISSATVKSTFARILNQAKTRLPRVNIDKIKARAQELAKEKKAIAKETTKQKKLAKEQAILSEELKQKGVILGEDFRLIETAPLTREEQLLLRAAKNKTETEGVARMIIEERSKGNAIGKGFTATNVENTPLNVSPRITE